MDLDWTMADAAQLAISEDDFRRTWDLVNSVAAGTIVPLKNPSQRGTVSIVDEDTVTDVAFTDTPYARMMFAVRDLFGRQNPVWMACQIRLDALRELYDDARMRRWLRQIDGSNRIFEGVLDAAATVPLQWGGEDEGGWAFAADAFFATVEAINASGKYRDTGEQW